MIIYSVAGMIICLASFYCVYRLAIRAWLAVYSSDTRHDRRGMVEVHELIESRHRFSMQPPPIVC